LPRCSQYQTMPSVLCSNRLTDSTLNPVALNEASCWSDETYHLRLTHGGRISRWGNRSGVGRASRPAPSPDGSVARQRPTVASVAARLASYDAERLRCEADDPMTGLAFKPDDAGTRLRAMVVSDLGHWDVPDACCSPPQGVGARARACYGRRPSRPSHTTTHSHSGEMRCSPTPSQQPDDCTLADRDRRERRRRDLLRSQRRGVLRRRGVGLARPWVPLRGSRHRSARHGDDVGAAPSPDTWSAIRVSPKFLQCLLFGASGAPAASSPPNHAKRPAAAGYTSRRTTQPTVAGRVPVPIFSVHPISTDTVSAHCVRKRRCVYRVEPVGDRRPQRATQPWAVSALYERRPLGC
jgi:hypothetical protein